MTSERQVYYFVVWWRASEISRPIAVCRFLFFLLLFFSSPYFFSLGLYSVIKIVVRRHNENMLNNSGFIKYTIIWSSSAWDEDEYKKKKEKKSERKHFMKKGEKLFFGYFFLCSIVVNFFCRLSEEHLVSPLAPKRKLVSLLI